MSNNKLTKITPESRNQLIRLVNKTAELVVAGDTPTDALVKAANNQQYSPEFILRAAEAYNGAAHLQHFKSAALDERGNTFDIVDGRKVLKDLIATNQIEKTSSTESVDLFSDDRYYFEPILPTYPMQKAASSVPTPKVDLKDIIASARKLTEQEKLAEEQARQTLLDSFRVLETKVSSAVKALGNLETAELTKVGSELAYTYGLAGFPVAVSMCKMTPEDCVKLATQTNIVFRSVETPEIKKACEVVDACEDCHKYALELGTKQADLYVNSLERTEALNSLLGIDTEVAVDSEKIANNNKETPNKGDLNNLNMKQALNAPSAVAGTLVFKGMDSVYNPINEVSNRAFSPAPQADSQLRGIQALLDPAFLREVKEIEMATVMKKILQDPIISTHSPRAIEEALYELQSLAPQATIYEPLLRAMLRKRLESEGRLDDVEINQLVDIDAKLQNRDVPDDLFPTYSAGTQQEE